MKEKFNESSGRGYAPPKRSRVKSFFGGLFTSCLGTILGLAVLVGVGIMIVNAMSPVPPTTKPNSVLKLSLSQAIPELTNNVSQQGGDLESLFKEHIGLSDLCALIDHAKNDDHIKGIYLDMSGVGSGLTTLKTVRKKLTEFKESGKFIVAYGNYYSQRGYYLASVASELYLHPLGAVDFLGFSAQIMYYKGLMDKMGVKFQIYYAGKFKSATEPFRRTDMSDANRKQVRAYVGGAYDLFLKDISESRDIPVAELYKIADNALVRRAEDAEKYKLVDGVRYKDEILDDLRDKLATKEKEKIQVVSLKKYYEINKVNINKYKNADKIAVVYAEGSIVDGQGDQGSIGGDKYASIIRKIRKDDKVKAIVIRVNSGGGSALASDIIWREIEKAKEQGISVVASMGDVAASGGYYISANADRIFAEDNTITGSIGVFGMIPNTRGLMEGKLGLTMDTVKTGKFSSSMSGAGFYEFTEQEGQIIQESIDEIYTVFKTRVSDGRKMSMANVDSIAQGRVWLGTKAKEIGLVDELGGLEEALASAAQFANLTDYRVVSYPKTKSFQESLMESFGGDNEEDATKAQAKLQALINKIPQNALAKELGDFYPIFENFKKINEYKGIQMRMPFEIVVE
ncbi:MAG: signal peptide peptidase SppA [Aureispira sp.]|nr:signal peptide peptidase SppA [Aureispira sp.]